jgi:hypothetical protein
MINTKLTLIDWISFQLPILEIKNYGKVFPTFLGFYPFEVLVGYEMYMNGNVLLILFLYSL